jgi:hypothetical protein
MSEKLGRLPEALEGKEVVLDNPSRATEAIISKIDELIDALVALDAANTGVPEVAALEKLKFKL